MRSFRTVLSQTVSWVEINQAHRRGRSSGEKCPSRGDRFSWDACESVEELFTRPDVEVVPIATPPFTHRDLVVAAIVQRKHVLCEKLLAIKIDVAVEMFNLASEQGCVLSVKLIMRFHPLCQKVKRIVDEKFLGEPLHGFFVKDARDKPLPPEHWLWDRKRSGGIFIEHEVYFFDLIAWRRGK